MWHLLIVSPHPDDMLACAGLIQYTLDTGGNACVALVTCGDGNASSALRFIRRRGFSVHPNPYINCGYYRQEEESRGLEAIGLSRNNAIWLGYPDGKLWRIWTDYRTGCFVPIKSNKTKTDRVPYENALTPGAPFSAKSILRDLESVISRVSPRIIIVPHPNDHHTDHAATYYLVREVLWNFPAQYRPDLYCTHGPHAQRLPLNYHRSLRFVPPKRHPSPTQWYELPLTQEMVNRKLLATEQYASQMAWEHPWTDEYPRYRSYLYGYTASNELFGRVLEPREDPRFRRRKRLSISVQRFLGMASNFCLR